jgi:hypothetical protein
MKKLFYFILILLNFVVFRSNVNAQCYTVTVEVFPLDPQSGNHNYFGVRVSLAQVFGEDVTVNGYIHDEGDPNTNHPFELIITEGNLTAETSSTFYETSPTSIAVAYVSSVTPCPYSEAIVATYSLVNNTYTINLSPQNQTLLSALENMFSISNATIDSLVINDDDPSTLDSASYLVFYVTAINTQFSFGILLDKYSDNNQIIYKINNQQASSASNRQASVSAETAWSCKHQSLCWQCVGHRNWFLGRVKSCDCGNSGQANDCIFEDSGSGFPWGPFLTFLAAIIALIT